MSCDFVQKLKWQKLMNKELPLKWRKNPQEIKLAAKESEEIQQLSGQIRAELAAALKPAAKTVAKGGKGGK